MSLITGSHEFFACYLCDTLERVHHRGDDDGRVALPPCVVQEVFGMLAPPALVLAGFLDELPANSLTLKARPQCYKWDANTVRILPLLLNVDAGPPAGHAGWSRRARRCAAATTRARRRPCHRGHTYR